MEKIFSYTFGRRIRWVSIGVLILIVAAVFALYLLYDGGYISAWFLSITVAIIALCVLSIPRHIRIDDARVEIHCILEMTEIELIDIVSVERVERREMRWALPIMLIILEKMIFLKNTVILSAGQCFWARKELNDE